MIRWPQKFFNSFKSREKSITELAYHQTRTGNYYLPCNISTDIIINEIKQGRVFEPHILEVASKFIVPGSVVLDVGANFGQMSILFSKMVGSTGRVYSFEADDFIFEVLKRNIEANQANNINAVYGAVSNLDGETKFYPKPDFKRFKSFGSYGIDPTVEKGRSVESITIDSLAIESRISFMKVDIQGSDLLAMQGAVNTIRKHQMPIIFEYEEQFQNEFGTSLDDYMQFVEDIGYRIKDVVKDINYLVVPS